MNLKLLALLAVAAFGLSASLAKDPCKSGLQPNQRPGPYSALVCIGKERGTQHCYVCEAEDRPIAIVFARTMTPELGKLVKKIDDATIKHKDAELRAWVTILADDQTSLDRKVVAWGKEHSVNNVPVAVFEDLVGPPAYRISSDADVTVLLSVKQKVAFNFAYRPGELNDAAIQAIVQAIPKMAKK